MFLRINKLLAVVQWFTPSTDLIAPVAFSIVLFLMAVSPPPQYIN